MAEHRCAYLLASLVVFLISGAVSKRSLTGDLIELSAFLLVMITAVASMAEHRLARVVGMILALPFVAAYLLAYANDPRMSDRPSLVAAAASLPFMVLSFWTTFTYTIRRAPITTDRMFGAAAAFLLMAVAWAGLYAVAELVQPGSFRTPPELATVVLNDLTYFSMVTQTTLGYGDITPARKLARSFAMLQSSAGLFYMGAIVAYLVTAHSSSGWAGRDGGPRSGTEG